MPSVSFFWIINYFIARFGVQYKEMWQDQRSNYSIIKETVFCSVKGMLDNSLRSFSLMF